MDYWIQNKHGVKMAVDENTYKTLMAKVGFSNCEPDEVPATKQYPISDGLTEAGLRRRQGATASSAAKKAHKAKKEAKAAPVKAATLDEETEEVLSAQAKYEAGQTLTKDEYMQLAWPDLKKYAASRGVNTYQTTKAEVLAGLDGQ